MILVSRKSNWSLLSCYDQRSLSNSASFVVKQLLISLKDSFASYALFESPVSHPIRSLLGEDQKERGRVDYARAIL